MAQTNRKIFKFLDAELNDKRVLRWTTHHDVREGNTVHLYYPHVRGAYEASGILCGMGCLILKQEMTPSGQVSLLIALPSPKTSDSQVWNECEACDGIGIINGETCWHCEGEGIDPTL